MNRYPPDWESAVQILEMEVYTSQEVQKILKISPSTFMRLMKRQKLKATKIGGQYRILGRDLLEAVSPSTNGEALAYEK